MQREDGLHTNLGQFFSHIYQRVVAVNELAR